MNRHCYRIIFNKTLGRMVVVSERSKSQGKSTEPAKSNVLALILALASLGLSSLSHAEQVTTQIIADKTAPKIEQPVIISTASGLPQVNIQTPSQAGVSKNQYSQFDVGQQGIILNNSRHPVNTQLAGYVAGNPYLARGEAKVILNQVNSNNPSQLKGYVEVAGKRAEVVIANPSGIQVDGGGFINAQGAVLSTGQARFDGQGNITHYDISQSNTNGQQGKIQIEGKGLSSGESDYTKLISHYNQINAEVFAGQGDLEVQTGTQLDVSKLGGMYAGKIRLVGTEKGLGVTQATAFNTNNAGIVSAKESLALDSQGNLVNTGTLASEQQLDLNVNKLSNETGQIIANQADIRLQQDYTHSDAKQIQANALSLSTQGKLTNTQHLTSNDKLVLQAKQIENQGVINSQQTTLTASETIDNLGGKIYGTQLQIDAKTLNNRPHKKGDETSHTAPIIAGRETVNIQVETLNNQANPDRAGKFNRDFNHQSLILSEGTLNITANTVNNIGASIESAGDMRISAQTLNNKNADYTQETIELEKKNETRFQGLNVADLTQYQPEEITEYTGQGVDGSIRTMSVNGTEISYRDYARLDYTKTLMGDKTIKSDPSRILSGANIHFDLAEFNTNKSQIIAGQKIHLTGQVANVESEPTSITPYYYYNPSVMTQYIYVVDGGKRSGCVGNIGGCRYDITRTLGPMPYAISPSAGESYQLKILNITDEQGINTAISKADRQQHNTTIVMPNLSNINTSGLFQVSGNSNYVIQTDPAFTNGKLWLGSQFMTDQLGYQADPTHKRLGDGYYEQQLIKDQILALTGRRYLSDYRSDDEQYRALMDNALTVAKPLNLRIGIGLTAEQIAGLTSDIVWLVEQEVTLQTTDGQQIQQKVLVPTVYVRAEASDLTGTGSLIAARNVNLNLTGKLNNQGHLLADQNLTVQAHTINNQNTGVIKGDFVQLNAQGNINNIGGTLGADSAMSLTAGKDIENRSSIYQTESQVGASQSERTGIDRIGQIYVGTDGQGKTDEHGKPLITLQINADGQYIAQAGQIHNAGGTTQLTAKQGVELGAVNVGYRQEAIADANNYYKESHHQDIGSHITGQDDIVVHTQGNISATATTLSSQKGTVALIADGTNSRIDINAGRHQQSVDTAYRIKDRGLLSSNTTQSRYSHQNDDAISSQIDGKQVFISASQDINLTAAQVVSEDQTQIQAGRDVHLNSSTNHTSTEYQHDQKKSGLMDGEGIGFSLGKEKTGQSQHSTSLTHQGSMVGSLNGDTQITAGRNYSQTASTVSSLAGNVQIQAEQVHITSADNQYQSTNKTEYEKKGISVALNVPIMSAVQNTINTSKQVGASKNDRINAMAATNTAWQGYQTLTNLKQTLTTPVSASISYGEQKNTTEQQVTGTTAAVSQVVAGGQVQIKATGDKQSTIEIQGSDVAGKQGTTLIADHDVKILSAAQQQIEQSNNRSEGWNAGVNVGLAGDIAVTGGVNQGKGNGESREISHRHSQVGDRASQTRIEAGNQLEIKGGQVQGKQVTVNADRLSISSVQDQASHRSTQQDSSLNGSLGQGATVGGSYQNSKLQAEHVSVNQLSGIFAGDEGFDIKVKDNTHLAGAVITSTETAEEKKRNRLETGTLSTTALNNHSEYSGKGIGVNVNASLSKQTNQAQDSKQADSKQANSKSQYSKDQSVGYGKDGDNQSSTTQGGIYTSNIIISDKTQQAELAKGKGQTLEQSISEAKTSTTTEEWENNGGRDRSALENRFDEQTVRQEIGTQVSVVQQFNETTKEVKLEIGKREEQARQHAKDKQQAAEVAFAEGNFVLAEQLLAERDEAQQKAEQWQYGKVAVDALGKALSTPADSVTGQVASGLSPAGAYAIGQYFKNNDAKNRQDGGTRAGEGSTPHLIAHGLLSAAVSYATGERPETITASTITTMGAEKLVQPVASYLFGKGKAEDLSAEEKQTLSNVLGTVGLVVGAVTAQSNDADSYTTATSAVNVQSDVQNAVDNNGVNVRQQDQAVKTRLCKQAGVSGSACDSYYSNLKANQQIDLAKSAVSWFIPTSPEELALAAITGGVGGKVIGKVIGKFTSRTDAEKALAEAKSANTAHNGAAWNTNRPIYVITQVDDYYRKKTDNSVLSKIDMSHIAQGHINASNKAVGFHHEPSGGNLARVSDYKSAPDSKGVYQGQVQIRANNSNQWIQKVDRAGNPSGSTFFPRSWSQARLEYEISEAFKSHPTSKTSTSFIATSPSGIKIKFVPPSGKITKWRGWPIQ